MKIHLNHEENRKKLLKIEQKFEKNAKNEKNNKKV